MSPQAATSRVLFGGLVAVFLAALIVYWPGLSGPFVLDDEANIVRNEHVHVKDLTPQALWTAAWTGLSGPAHRPISNLSFALNYYLGGLDPFGYKLTNVVIHGANGVALGFLAWLLLNALRRGCSPSHAWAAIAVAAIWTLHPFNLTPALYVVQRMTSLATLFTVGGLISYMVGRSRLTAGSRGWPWLAAAFLFFLPSAVLSKESGVLLLLYILVLEAVVFRQTAAGSEQRNRFVWLLVLAVLTPLIVASVSTLISPPDWYTHGYAGRDFTLVERLLTQSRIVSWYLRMALLPTATETGLTLDDFAYSRSLVDPPWTLLAIAFLAALLTVGLVVRRTAPVLSIGILWFFAGHMLESTALPLEMAFEHRTYLPSFGPLLAVGYYAIVSPFTQRWKSILVAGLAFYGVLTAGTTLVRADQWSHPEKLLMTELEHRPNSSRSQALAAEHYAALATNSGPGHEQAFGRAVYHYERSLEIDPKALSSMVGLMVLHQAYGRPEPPDLWPRIFETARSAPVTASAVNAIGGLTHCLIDGYCSLPDVRYSELTGAALENPTTSPANQALILTYAGEYAVGKTGDLGQALAYSERAIGLRPYDSLGRFQRVRWLVMAARYPEARAEIEEIRRRDWLGVWARAADDWERLIEDGHEGSTESRGAVEPPQAKSDKVSEGMARAPDS